jgi:outer membrane protein TolC
MRSSIFLIFLCCAFQSTLAQQPLSREVDNVYLDKIIEICKTNYPKGKMYDDRAKMAENGIKKARLSYFDIFSFSYLYSPNNNTATISPTFLGGYQFGFFANIGSFLQKPAQVKIAKGEYQAALHDKEAFDLSMIAEVKKRYFMYIQKIAVLKIRSASALDMEGILTTIKHRFEKGEETLENYNKALMMQSDHQQNIINAESEVMIAKSALEELLGQKLEDIK